MSTHCKITNYVRVFTTKLAHYHPPKLEVGSMIQFGNPVKYGVIKKIETTTNTSKGSAEVETVSHTLAEYNIIIICSHMYLHFVYVNLCDIL